MKFMQFKKVAASVLAGTMLMSCASCGLFGANKKEIIEAADTFASALVKQDAGKIVKLTNEKKDSDTAEALEILFDKSMYSDDQNDFIKAVGDTLAYEVDEESVEVDKEEASVEVVFTMVDYEKALDDDYEDIDDVIDALKDCDDKKEVTVTFEFEKDDDEWLISNLKDKDYGKLFDFYTYELAITPDLTDCVDDTSCWSGSTAVYSTVYFSVDVSDYADYLTFDLYCDGSPVATNQPAEVYGTYIYCDYYDPNYENLPSGDYEVVVMCGETEIVTMTTTIDAYEPEPTSYGNSSYDYNVYGQGELGDYVVATDWWSDDDYHNYLSTNGFFELDIYFTTDITYDDIQNMTYKFYDADYNDISGELTIPDDKTNVDGGYPDSDGYYFIYAGWVWPDGEIDPGYYYIEVFNPDGTTLYLDYCYVE